MAIAASPMDALQIRSLQDPLGRRPRKVRVSLTEACNFRCFYCMAPDAIAPHDPRALPPEAIASIVANLARFGIDAVRLTGGEPTMRREFPEIVRAIGAIPGITRGLTTNGQFLERHVPDLVEAGFTSVNISVDSLDEVRFRSITRGGDLGRVLAGLRSARDAGMRTKVNCVVARGVNDDEIENFHDFSIREHVEVRFLELMRIGPARDEHARRFVTASEIVQRLQERSPLLAVDAPADSTAFLRRSAAGARLGFIASESQPFCTGCSRLRLSSRGFLRACLFKEDGLPLLGVPLEQYAELLGRVFAMKPVSRLSEIPQPMNQIGG